MATNPTLAQLREDERFSKIPPMVLHHAANLPSSDRRVYVQQLIGKYEEKVNHLDRIMRDMILQAESSATLWKENQHKHFETVLNQLYVLRDA